MNKYRFTAEVDSVESFDIEAPTLEQAAKVYGILYMGENPTTTDLWVSVLRKRKWETPKQVRIKVQTTVEYVLEEYNPLTQEPNKSSKARGFEIGTRVVITWGNRQGEVAGIIVGFDADGDPLVKDGFGVSSWLSTSLTKAENLTE